MFLRWLSTEIAQTVPLPWTRWPPELKIEKSLNDFASLTSASILKNIYRGMFLRSLYTKIAQTVLFRENKMAVRAKNRKTFKRLLLLNQRMDFEIIILECFRVTLYQNCSKTSATLNKMAARAINRNKLLTTSPAKSVDRFWNNFTGMFLRWLYTKIAQTLPLRWTRWPPELRIEKSLNHFASFTSASF